MSIPIQQIILILATLIGCACLILTRFLTPSALTVRVRHMIYSATLWCLSWILLSFTGDTTRFMPPTYIGGIYFFHSFYRFSVNYTAQHTPAWQKNLISIGSYILAVLTLVPNTFIISEYYNPAGYVEVAQYGPIAPVLNIFILSVLALITIQFVRAHTRLKHDETYGLVTSSSILAGIGMVCTNIVLPYYFNIHNFNSVGPALWVIFSVMLLYAVSTKRLLRVETFIQQYLISAILTLVFLITAAAFAALLSTTVGSPNMSLILAVLSTFCTAIVFGPHLHHSITTTVNNWLYGKNSAEHIINELTELFATYPTRDALIKHTIQYLTQTLKLEALVFVPEVSMPERLRWSACIPVAHKNTIIGHLCAKARLGGIALPTRDTHVLTVYAAMLGMVFNNATLYGNLEAEVKAQTNALSALHTEERERYQALAHRLNSSLTVIHSMLELHILEAHRSHPRLNRILEVVRQLASDTTGSVHALFDKKYTPAEKTPCTPIALEPILHALLEEYAPLAEAGRVKLSSYITPCPPICIQSDHAREIIVCLIENAIRYTSQVESERSIRVVLGMRHGTVRLGIYDTGIGIPASDKPHIFKHGFRASNTEGIGGTGVGLAIVAGIAEQYNLTVEVDDAPARGTEMRVYFPHTH